MSAVILVEHAGENICLLAADSGYQSLEDMIHEKTNMKAPMLVFPHHGGNVGGTSDNKAFAKRLVAAVEPQVVVFSTGRGSHGTPRTEIVSGVREGMTGRSPYIACTQLSKNCAAKTPKSTRLLNKHSEGLSKDACCAGTVTWPLVENGLKIFTDELNRTHNSFVVSDVPDALCRRHFGTIPVKTLAP
jgi:competence protein ComEC